MSIYKERLRFAIQHFAVGHLLLLILFWSTRLFELASFGLTGLFPAHLIPIFEYGFLNNALFWAFFSFCVFPFYVLFYVLIGSSTRYILLALFVVSMLVYVSLVQYFLVTRTLLGAEFWNYSVAEVLKIVKDSEAVGWTTFIPHFVALGLLFWLYPKAQEIMLEKRYLIGVYAVIVIGSVGYAFWAPSPQQFSGERDYAVSVSKIAFFCEQSFRVLLTDETNQTVNEDEGLIQNEYASYVFSQAEKAMLDSVGADSLSEEQLFDLARKNAELNNFEWARLIAMYALNQNPDYTDMRILLGWTYGWQNNYKEAKKVFEDCMLIEPENSQPWKELISLEIKYRRYTRAIEHANEAFELFQDDSFKILKQKALLSLSEHKK